MQLTSHIRITSYGWPWQRVHHCHPQTFGWNPFIIRGFGRFGGSWAIKFGITISRKCYDICIDLIIGGIRIQYIPS